MERHLTASERPAGPSSVSVVIPAFNATATLGRVLDALARQDPSPAEVIVVDDGSTDGTADLARQHGAWVVATDHKGFAGGARNRGWSEARGEIVVFLDADVVPHPDWGAALARALEAYPGAAIGCARSFTARTSWGWVAHLQVETPYLPRGEPRPASFLSSYCLALPRDLPVRWDESYGGEDALFSADIAALGVPLVFDPRIVAAHEHTRESFRELRRQQQRLAYGLARCAPIQRHGLHRRVFSRVPLHYFLLLRLPAIYGRLGGFPELRERFIRLLPRLVLAEWTLGLSACRYVFRRPALRTGAETTPG
jgi:cellulose synthase/poly-beta-1,6-N-acetylglucosamine synthase-like glycosyltransferase